MTTPGSATGAVVPVAAAGAALASAGVATQATAATLAALAVAYNSQQQRLRDAVGGLVRQLFAALTSWRSADAAGFVAEFVPTLLAAEQEMASLTGAYLGQHIGLLAGGPTTPLPVATRDVTGSALRGVAPAEVYQRPFHQIWTDLSQGRTLDAAVARAEQRAENLAVTDLQLAKTHTVRAVVADDERVAGYRRVLTGAENCGLCVVASTQRYHKRDLMPIHPGCDCAVGLIIDGRDPGQVINSAMLAKDASPDRFTKRGVPIYSAAHTVDVGDLLEPVHDAVQETFGASDRGARHIDYRKVITVHQHGEIGPVLTVTGHRFTKKQAAQAAAPRSNRRTRGA